MKSFAVLLALFWLVACSDSGQPSPIFGYRLLDEHTISVKASTGAGFETWVASVDQKPTAVVVQVRTRATSAGAGAPVAKYLWFTVELDAALGNRSVLDAIGPTPVARVQ